MRKSFALRLAAAFAGVGISAAALTAILVNLAFGGRFTAYLEEQQQARGRQLVAALADSYGRLGGWSREDLDSVAPMALMDGGTIRVEDASGKTLWSAESDTGGGHMSAIHRQMMGTGPLGPEERLPVMVGGISVGTAIVRLPQPGLLPNDTAFRSSVNRLLLAGGIAAGIVALLVGILLARRATAPARDMSRAARRLASGDRSVRIADEAPDEFGEMARSFNAMADSIEEEDRLRRAFAADVAHEVRTPLAILRSEVEALQDGVIAPGPPALSSLHDEILRIERLIADLEALASADAAGFSLERRVISLRSVLEQAVAEYRDRFEASGLSLAVELDEVEAWADATRVRQIVGNLLSNALKFTPEGGEVKLELRAESPWALIAVSDTGPGIPPDELPRVFDRFFRGRGARAGGSGIGLTVVRDLVQAHGGEVDVDSQPRRGAIFLVRFPATSQVAWTPRKVQEPVPAS